MQMRVACLRAFSFTWTCTYMPLLIRQNTKLCSVTESSGAVIKIQWLNWRSHSNQIARQSQFFSFPLFAHAVVSCSLIRSRWNECISSPHGAHTLKIFQLICAQSDELLALATERCTMELRGSFPPKELLVYSVFVLKRGGAILLALNRVSVRLVSSEVGDALGSVVIVK